MNFTQEAFSQEIDYLYGFIDRKKKGDLGLDCFYILLKDNKLIIHASNGNNIAYSEFEYEHKKENEGFFVNAEKLKTLVSSLKNREFTLNFSKSGLIIKSGKFKSKIAYSIQPPFQIMPQDGVLVGEMDFVNLKIMIQSSLFACDSNPQRAGGPLENVCFRGDTILSTDGYRMCVTRHNNSFSGEFLVHTSSMGLLVKNKRGGKVQIYDHSSFVEFRFESSTSFLRRSSVKYPQVEKLIPKTINKQFVVDRAELREAINLTSTMVKKDVNVIDVEFKDKEMQITATSQEGVSKYQLETDSEDEFDLKLNISFLKEIVNIITSKEVTFKIVGPMKPILMENQVGEFKQEILIMPIQAD